MACPRYTSFLRREALLVPAPFQAERRGTVRRGRSDNRQCLSWSLTPCPTRQAGASYRAVPAWVSLQCPFQCPLRLVKLARPLPLTALQRARTSLTVSCPLRTLEPRLQGPASRARSPAPSRSRTPVGSPRAAAAISTDARERLASQGAPGLRCWWKRRSPWLTTAGVPARSR